MIPDPTISDPTVPDQTSAVAIEPAADPVADGPPPTPKVEPGPPAKKAPGPFQFTLMPRQVRPALLARIDPGLACEVMLAAFREAAGRATVAAGLLGLPYRTWCYNVRLLGLHARMDEVLAGLGSRPRRPPWSGGTRSKPSP